MYLCILLLYIVDVNDYESVDVSVAFEPQLDGQPTPQCINVTIINNEILETSEMLTVEIQSPSQGVVPDPLASIATVTITDDDSMSYNL